MTNEVTMHAGSSGGRLGRLDKAGEMNSARFRQDLGHYASGLTIVAGLEGDTPVGFTCQSFHSVSLEPPLISFNVMKASTSWPRMRSLRNFSVNVLSRSQGGVCRAFARSGTDKWAGVDWDISRAGNPHIRGAMLHMDCALETEHDAGDHTLILARVVDWSTPAGAQEMAPLLFYRGQLCTVSQGIDE